MAAVDRVHRHPRVHFDADGVRAFEQVGERIESGLDVRVFGERLGGIEIEAVAAPPHLRDDRVGVRFLHSRDELIDLRPRLQSRGKRVGPERTDLFLTFGARRGRSREQDERKNDEPTDPANLHA